MKPALCCPACRTEPMVTMVDRQTGLELDSCSQCFGLWFDGNELSALFPSRSLANRVLHEHHPHPPSSASEGSRCCSRCQVVLRNVQVEDIALDLCGKCQGIWFDDGEIQRLAAASRHGLHGEREVVEQMALGRALEGLSGLTRPVDTLGSLLDRLVQARA